MGLAATLSSVGWDYLRDWISEEGLPKDHAFITLLGGGGRGVSAQGASCDITALAVLSPR